MKNHKKLIIAISLLIALGAVGTVIAEYLPLTPIRDVFIQSPNHGAIVFANAEIFCTCTTSWDVDCNTVTQNGEYDPITYTWSGAGTFDPTTGSFVSWTAPGSVGDVNITVTADDSPLYDETAKTHTITLTVSNIIYVDKDNTGPQYGTTWANAFRTIGAALSAAGSGNEIWVAEGTYKPSYSERTDTFQLVSNTGLYGGFDGTETSRSQRDYVNNVTILSGDIGTPGVDTDNSYHVVTGVGDANTVIDGFTITKGYGTADGAGMQNSSCSPTIANCIFDDNKSDGGDGDGGGMHNQVASPTVTNCIFINNSAGDDGGALCNKKGSNGTFTNCVFFNNSTDGDNEGKSDGGAIFNTEGEGAGQAGSSPTFINCVIVDNYTVRDGGGVCNVGYDTDPIFTNCTFTGNDANDDGGAMAIKDGSDTTITNCIFWNDDAVDNDDEIFDNDVNTTVAVTYSDVEGGHAGTGNENVDPNFVDVNDPDGNDDTWMTSDDGLMIGDSNCIDSANGNVDPTTDILGNSRYDDPNTSNTGIGDPNYVDMGAYEKQSS